MNKNDRVIKPVTYKDMLTFKRDIKRPPKGSNYDPFSEFPLS